MLHLQHAGRRPTGQVQQSAHPDEQGAPADHPPAAVRLVSRGPHQLDRTDQQQDRQGQREVAEEQPQYQRDVTAERTARVEPHRRREQQGEGEYEQAGTVPAVFGLQLPGVGGAPPGGADQPADPVGQAHPQQPEQAAQHIERTGHPGGTRGKPAPPGRTSTPARLRGAARHAVTVTARSAQVRKARRR